MQIKVIKINDEGKKEVLDINFDSDERAIVGDRSVDESEKIIREFIEGKPADNKPAEEPAEKADENEEGSEDVIGDGMILDDAAEFVLNKDNYTNQSITVKDGTLILEDDIDPTIKIENGILVYRGYTVEISKKQLDIIDSMSNTCSVVFEQCLLNYTLHLLGPDTCIDGGAYVKVEHGLDLDVCGRIMEETCSTIKISNGAKIDHLVIHGKSILYVNASNYEMDDDNTVHIDHLDVSGRAILKNCNIEQLHVCYTGEVELDGDIGTLDVCGTVFLGEAHVGKIILHPGGRVFGDIDDVSIEATERPMQYITAIGCIAG